MRPDLICVDHAGTVVEGDWPVNVAAFAIHSQVHRARPDVIAAAHAHSVYGKTFSSLGVTLDPLTQGLVRLLRDHALFDDFTGVVVDTAEGARIAEALGTNKMAILRNHGLLTVGTSVDTAAWWFITAERTCQSQLAAMAAGKPVSIDDEHAELTHGRWAPSSPASSASTRSTSGSWRRSLICWTELASGPQPSRIPSGRDPQRRGSPKEQPPGISQAPPPVGSGNSGKQPCGAHRRGKRTCDGDVDPHGVKLSGPATEGGDTSSSTCRSAT